jgi:hypothetical protein
MRVNINQGQGQGHQQKQRDPFCASARDVINDVMMKNNYRTEVEALNKICVVYGIIYPTKNMLKIQKEGDKHEKDPDLLPKDL